MSASQAAAGDAALVNVTFEGKPCAVPAGKTVAAALLGTRTPDIRASIL